MSKSPDILFEDEHLIAVNKSADLLSIPDTFYADRTNAKTEIEQQKGKIYVNHRLDRETTGVLLFSKTAESHQAMNTLWQSREVHKTYWALVDGNTPKEGKIDLPIMVINDGRKAKIHEKQGKEALTFFNTIESFGLFSLVELKIQTGRLHQIRVHMKQIGHALMIDKLYGHRDAFYLSEFKYKYRHKSFKEERPLMSRLSLHAKTLSFVHPFTNEGVCIEAPLPKDFRASINQLKKLG
jgi:RluA family pseudouridine synthase